MNTKLISDLRDMFAEAEGRDFSGTDEAIVEIIEANPGDDDDDDVQLARVEAMGEVSPAEGADNGGVTVEKTEAATVDVSAQDQHDQRAFTIAGKLDDAFGKVLEGEIEAREKTKTGALRVRDELVRVFTSKGLLELPFPDLPAVDKTTGVKNNNPDKYIKYVKIDGEMKKKNASFWGDTFDKSSIGREYTAKINGLKAAKESKKDAPSEFLGLSDADRGSEMAKWTQRRTDGIALLKRAVKIEHRWHEIEEAMGDKVGIRLSTIPKRDIKGNVVKVDGKEVRELRRTPKPIVLFSKEEEGTGNAVSIGTFLSFDIAKSVQNGGALSDLLATTGRAGNNGQGESETPVDGKAIKTLDELTGVLGLVASFLDDASPDGKKHAAQLAKAMAAKTEDADHLIRTVGGTCMVLDDLWTKIEARYRALVVRDAAKAA